MGMCCPRLRVARSRAWSTRTYARVWTRLPWVIEDAIGGGFYAVRAEGRRRWSTFRICLPKTFSCNRGFENKSAA